MPGWPRSEMVQAVTFLGFFSALMRVLRDYRGKAVLVLGAWCGAIVNSKELFVLAVPGAFLFGPVAPPRPFDSQGTLRCVGLGPAGDAGDLQESRPGRQRYNVLTDCGPKPRDPEPTVRELLSRPTKRAGESTSRNRS